MHEVRFAGIAERLLRAGVAPRHVRRTVFELAGHFEDLRTELRARGLSEAEVDTEASARLGADAIVDATLAQPELRSWTWRRPVIAFTILPLATYAALFVTTLRLLVIGVNVSARSSRRVSTRCRAVPARSPSHRHHP
jgi:hypothetical protein